MCRFSFSSSIYCIVGFISNPTNTQTHNNQTSSQVDANQFGIGLSSITWFIFRRHTSQYNYSVHEFLDLLQWTYYPFIMWFRITIPRSTRIQGMSSWRSSCPSNHFLFGSFSLGWNWFWKICPTPQHSLYP